MRIHTQFQSGEEAVTLDPLPLINVIAKEGRIQKARGRSLEELYGAPDLFIGKDAMALV